MLCTRPNLLLISMRWPDDQWRGKPPTNRLRPPSSDCCSKLTCWHAGFSVEFSLPGQQGFALGTVVAAVVRPGDCASLAVEVPACEDGATTTEAWNRRTLAFFARPPTTHQSFPLGPVLCSPQAVACSGRGWNLAAGDIPTRHRDAMACRLL